ncbi:BMP family lipoprotein [Euzebya tangerina]|uniref:BMP family lipoprotein n=1 Tax=Euzebya tangerina TaxID=591198 RepID=UPI0013C3270B|nr:BMP family ABC transporter substrate-binding protein [Euzebya tangerina]
MTTLSRRMAMLALLLILSLVAAACADDGADEADEDTEPTEEAMDEEEPTEDAMDEEPMDEEEPTEDAMDEEAMDEEEPTEEAMDEEAMDEGDEVSGGATLEDVCADYEGTEVPEDFNVGLVTDIGRIDDGTFNQFANDGMEAAADCLGFETNVIETASEADYSTNIETILESDPEVVVTVGFLLADTTLEAANANPDINFIGIDQFQEEYPENYVGILFREDQGGYIAGAMAALLSESGTVGVVGGLETVPPVVRFVNGYEAGAQSVNPDINVLSVYTDSFTDPAQGASAAEQFLGEGADVIFGAGGQTGSGAVQAAAEAGAWGIGVDQDEYFTTFGGGSSPGADRLATSAIKRVDLGTFVQIGESLTGDFSGGIFTLDAANGGISYAPFHDADVPDDVASQIEEVRAGLADGSIETGIDPVTGLPQ